MEAKRTEKLCELLETTLTDETRGRDKLSSLDSVTVIERLLSAMDHLKHLEYMELKSEYYDTALEGMRDGGYGGRSGNDGDMMHSGRRRRDSEGRYRSGNDGGSYNDRRSMRGRSGRMDDEDYMDAKRSYRSGTGGESKTESKERMMAALERNLNGMADEFEEYCRDTDCPEEKDMIRRIVRRMQNMID